MAAQKSIPFGYETRKLQEQFPKILSSKQKAWDALHRKLYFKIVPLSKNDPAELQRFAFSHVQPDPGNVHVVWKKTSGQPRLREIVKLLNDRDESDEVLADHLAKALKIYNRSDTDLPALDPTDRLLVNHWIRSMPEFTNPTDDPSFFTGSLCFYADEAMSKMLYYLEHHDQLCDRFYDKKYVPKIRLETGRVKQRCKRLNLLSARPRIFTDVEFKKDKHGRIVSARPLPFEKRIL